MIGQYLKHCSEDDFDPLGGSTLFRILQVREASQRTSLQELDNIAARGAEAFDNMHKIVDDLKDSGASATWCDEIQKGLKDESAISRQNIECTAVKMKVAAQIIAGALLSTTPKTPILKDLAHTNIKCYVTSVND